MNKRTEIRHLKEEVEKQGERITDLKAKLYSECHLYSSIEPLGSARTSGPTLNRRIELLETELSLLLDYLNVEMETVPECTRFTPKTKEAK